MNAPVPALFQCFVLRETTKAFVLSVTAFTLQGTLEWS
jgi:hypothetical protein